MSGAGDAAAAARDRKSADGGGEARTGEGAAQGVAAEAGGGVPGRRGSDTLGRRDNPGESRPAGSFAGMPGDATPVVGEGGGWSATDPENFLRENLSLKDLVSLAYMFNFSEAGVLGLGERKAVVQVRERVSRDGERGVKKRVVRYDGTRPCLEGARYWWVRFA